MTVQGQVLDIGYAAHGEADGPPVVLVHGWPDAARSWTPVAGSLAEAGYRVIVPDLRGAGRTTFRSPSTPRDGTGAALAADVLDLADGLGLDRFAVVGHDWGARTAYVLAAVAPDRIRSITALALAYQPRGAFVMPGFGQARAFWYQWLMYVEDGVRAVAADPVGFARAQWDTWSPAGWYDEAEFEATSPTFLHPDWVAVTLSAYRSRFLPGEPLDPRYDPLRRRLAEAEQIAVPTLMVQGGADTCDEPASSEGLDGYFDDYTRLVLDGVGHFPHREAPAAVAAAVLEHLRRSPG